jgi:VWFA-related protein
MATRRTVRLLSCATGIALLAGLAALAQQSPAPPAGNAQEPIDESSLIKVDVSLVNVLCTVRGKNGALIGNLEQSDFRLFEDGKEQEIRYFTRETDLPLTIGLLVDVSGSQANLIEVERRAASQFFEKVLRPKDLAFLISFGKDSELLQDSTSSPKILEEGLRELRLNANVGGIHPGPVPTLQNQAGTVLYDAVFLAAEERLRQEVGRKVMVVITDGEDYGSKVSRSDAIEAAQKADAVIYSIYYADGRYGGSDGDLKRMSEETGGRVLKVDRNHSLDDIFREIQDDMRSQYALAYSPTKPEKDGSFRKIEFKMSNKDYKVQARKGYYAIEDQF